jgi:hypothetical protein
MKRIFRSWAAPLLVLAVVWGCSENSVEVSGPGNGEPPLNTVTCLGCHSSEVALKASLGPTPALQTVLADDG